MANFWHASADYCGDADYIRQAGGTCYYYAILMPLFWSRTGRVFLGLVLDELKRMDAPLYRDIVSHTEPSQVPELLDKYALNGVVSPTMGTKFLKDHWTYCATSTPDERCLDFFDHMTYHAAKLLENKAALIRSDYPDLFRMFQADERLKGTRKGHITHSGMRPIDYEIVGNNGHRYQPFVTHRGGARTVVCIPAGGVPFIVFDMFLRGLDLLLQGRPFKHRLVKERWSPDMFEVRNFEMSRKVDNMLGLVLTSKTHVVPLIMCGNEWYAFNNWGVASTRVPFTHADLRELRDPAFVARNFPSVSPIQTKEIIYAVFDPPYVADSFVVTMSRSERMTTYALLMVLTAGAAMVLHVLLDEVLKRRARAR
jgi:hypothetical protein